MTEQVIIKSREKSKVKIGAKFGRLTAIKNCGIIKGSSYFKCKCICGTFKTIKAARLLNGTTKSCGCLAIECRTKHGMYNTIEYRTWIRIIQRCSNRKLVEYPHYGGRGITVCSEWLNSFEVFFKDMGAKPKGLTIERIDNDKGYSKENCCWGSRTAQVRNRRILKRNTTGINGVIWDKRLQKYCVKINADYKCHYIGLFADIEDAKTARIEAEEKYWK